VAASCLIPRRAPEAKRRFSVQAGIDGLRYMQERTREDPFYALASGVLHAGQTSYITQQPIVERVLLDPAREAKLADYDSAFKLIRGSGFSNLKARAWPDAIQCWQKWCKTPEDPTGAACLGRDGRLPARGVKLLSCMSKNLASGVMGRKSYNLMAEYMGCDQAVAVDRHVGNWLANSTGTLVWAQKVYYNRGGTKETCEAPFMAQERGPQRKPICGYEGRVFFTRDQAEAKSMRRLGIPAVPASFSDARFAMMKREIMGLAKNCNVRPAQLQVAAWMQGACDSLPAGAGGKLDFGRGQVVDCERVPRVDLGAPKKGFKLALREKVPGRAFRCRPDHLGDSGDPQPVDLVTKPVRTPFGAKIQFDEDMYPVVPEERLAFWTNWRPRRSTQAYTRISRERQAAAMMGCR
jgi:hypothetical protein